MRLRAPQFAIAVIAAGVLTFGVVFSLLTFSPSAAAPDQPLAPTEVPTATPVAVSADSLAPRVSSDNLAIGLPIAGSEALLRTVQPGDRLDIMASLAAPQTGGVPVTAVLVRGATVLRPADADSPLLVQVSAPDALMLAHVVMRGTHIGYVLWPANGMLGSATPSAIDDQTARAVLGLAQPTSIPPTAVPVTATPQAPLPTGLPAAPPTPRAGSGFLYQVQPNDTWQSIADTFGMPVAQLRQWNESNTDPEPAPGALVFIPRQS